MENWYFFGKVFLKLVLEYHIYILSFSYPKVYTKSSLVSRGLFCVNWDSVVKWGGLKSLTCSPKDFAGVRDKCQWTSQLVCLQKCTNKSSRQFSKKTAKKLLTGWLMTCEKVCEKHTRHQIYEFNAPFTNNFRSKSNIDSIAKTYVLEIE